MIELPVRQRGVCCDLELAVEPARYSDGRAAQGARRPDRLSMVASCAAWLARMHLRPPVGLPLSQPTISHHMGVLKEAGLLRSEKRGLWHFYSSGTTSLLR